MRYFSLLVWVVACGAAAAVRAEAPDRNNLDSFPRLRGFDVPYTADSRLFHDAAATGANAVRLILSPIAMSPNHSEQLWRKMLAQLPTQLQEAREQHLYVIVSLFNPPSPHPVPTAGKARDDWFHLFWNDPASEQAMMQQALETARVIAPFEGMVWLELKNEPLDRTDYPQIPHHWAEWAQAIITAVRQISQVPLVVQVGPGGYCSGFATFPRLAGTNLVYSLHSYKPLSYTHQGITQLVGTDLTHPFDPNPQSWPGRFSAKEEIWNKERLRQEFKPVIDFARENHVRIYVGEFGVARWAKNAAGYLQDSLELFEEYGWDWTDHAFRESTIWSMEHDDHYSASKDAQLSPTETDRAKVLKHFLQLNQK